MEVILKKVKITNSILNQTVILSSTDELNKFEVLGFCIVKTHKWIVLYNESTNELRKFLMFKEVIVDENHSTPFWIKVIFPVTYRSAIYQGKNEEDCNEFIKSMNEIKHQAEIKGQFYI